MAKIMKLKVLTLQVDHTTISHAPQNKACKNSRVQSFQSNQTTKGWMEA
jgi:hypothetical protein